MVLGLGKYKKYPGLLNLFIRWETFYAGFQYIGLAGWGFPYMAVGRNFGYTKSLYQKRGGFEAFKSRLSGDDDLFVNANADAAVRCITAKGSFTYSEPERTFGDWFRQKKRHLSAATAYSFSSKMQLGIFHLSLIFHYLALLAACWDATALVVILSCYLSRLGLSVLIFYINMQNSEDKSLTTWYSVLDLLFFVFNMVIVPIGFIARPKWRRRRIENSPQKTR